MNIFITIITFVFISTFSIGCTSMNNSNDLRISVDGSDCEGGALLSNQKESPKEPKKELPKKANPSHLWKWADPAKKR
jgi:hypothetical protein